MSVIDERYIVGSISQADSTKNLLNGQINSSSDLVGSIASKDSANMIGSISQTVLKGVGIKSINAIETSEESSGENIIEIELTNGEKIRFSVLNGQKGDTGEKGDKGDSFRYEDFTPEQLNLLKGKDGKDGINGKDGVDGKDGLNGKDGRDGIDGRDGVDGKDGEKGEKGDKGETGDSIYITSITESTDDSGMNTYTLSDGTIITIKNGSKGSDGINGVNGKDGKDGINGLDGKDGKDGEKGDPFTFEDFTQEQLDLLKGEKGEQGIQGLKGDKGDKGDSFTYNDFTQDQLNNLKGEKGERGDAFTYEDFTNEQLELLKGERGEQGEHGISGVYIGEEEPSDEEVNVWVDTDESFSLDLNQYITKELINTYLKDYATKNELDEVKDDVKDNEVTDEHINSLINNRLSPLEELSFEILGVL